MGLFNFFKKSTGAAKTPAGPYNNGSANLVYQLLFCDNIELYKSNTPPPYSYPFDVLFSDTSTVADLKKIIGSSVVDARQKALACFRLRTGGHQPGNKKLLAVIVEVGLKNGLDVLASFNDGTARYINQTGKILIWETPNPTSDALTQDLFRNGQFIVNLIGVWDKPRLPHPVTGSVRISMLVSDGLYFGEGPIDVLFNDPMASPALSDATLLMKYLTEQ